MAKYLDENGLLYFWGKIKSYVTTALSGSGFYTKPSSGIPKTDLADSVQTSLGKADTALQSYTETDPVFTASAAHGISSTDISNWNAAEANVVKSIDTTAGTSGINLSLSSTGKLDVTISSGSIASGNSNFVTGGTVYSTTSTLAPKASPALTGTPTAPTASEGTSTTQIATTAFVSTAIATAIGGITGIDFQIVQTLPASGEKGVIYLVPNSGSSPNSYDEYIWIVPTGGTGRFEKIGTTDVDLSGYLQISAYITNAEIDAIVAN
jgi:hypothetical protein